MVHALTFLTYIAVLFSGSAFAQTPGADVDTFVRGHMEQVRAPGVAVAVLQDGQVVKRAAYGVTDVMTENPVTIHTPFHIASISKGVTAVAIMMLVEDGMLSLDDEVGQHLNTIPTQWAPATVRQVLNHTSGLPDILLDPFSTFTIAETSEEVLTLLKDQPLVFEPGARWSYNQTNYMVLAMLIEKLSRQDYSTFIQSVLFDPLDLRTPFFGPWQSRAARHANVYTVFDFSGGQPQIMDGIEPLHEAVAPVIYPAGGLNISLADFAAWLQALFDGRFIGRESLQALWAPATLNDGTVFTLDRRADSPQWTGYGLGWTLRLDSTPQWVGGAGGLRAAFLYYPDHELVVVVFTNLQGAGPERLASGIAQFYLPD